MRRLRSLLPPAWSAGGCLVRFLWMFYGPLCMGVSIILDIRSRRLFGATDVLFWLSLAGCLILSYVDIAHLNRQYTPNQAMRVRSWRRIATILVGVSLLVWASAHAIAWFARHMAEAA